jgi:hypothetical protein
MTALMSALLGAALALILFIITQIILKFVIEPIQEQRRLIGEVAQALSLYSNVHDVHREGVEETRRALRSLSGRLWASLWAIPFYDAFALLGRVPKATDVMEAATELRVWSYSPDKVTEGGSMRRQDDIAKRLGITRKVERWTS